MVQGLSPLELGKLTVFAKRNQDSSPTRQFANTTFQDSSPDSIGDSSPTLLETVHRHNDYLQKLIFINIYHRCLKFLGKDARFVVLTTCV